MKRKIYNRLFATATLAIVVTLLLTVAVYYNLLKKQVLEDSGHYAQMAAGLLEGTEDIGKSLAPLTGENGAQDIRITVIGHEGDVLYDSQVRADSLSNHKSRPEVQEALTDGSGFEIRRSATLDENTYYYAMLLKDGTVLRIAREADSIYKVMEYAVPYLLLIVASLLVVCGIVSYYLAEGIIRPIRQIAESGGETGEVSSYEEMKPFIEAIQRQQDDVLENARLRQEFTANVSHELKTPLTAISGYAELVENGMVAEAGEVRRFCGEIHKNAGRLLVLINDVIRLSELDDSENQEAMEPVNLYECAKNCVDMLQLNAEKHGVTLTVSGVNVVISASHQMVDEVLYNLCDNAIRYNKEKGSVSVIVEDRLDLAVLTVKDTGIGIPREHQERIFERFYRVDKSRSKSTGGTGLGLAIVKHILLKLNAEIALKSEPGEGTEITVTFPAIREARFRQTS